jgi:hypothetical protein
MKLGAPRFDRGLDQGAGVDRVVAVVAEWIADRAGTTIEAAKWIMTSIRCAAISTRTRGLVSGIADDERRTRLGLTWSKPRELYPRVGFIVTNMSRPAERVVGSMPNLRRERGASAASCARLQPWQLPAHAGDQGLVTVEPEGEAYQDRCQGHQSRPHRRLVAEVAIPRQMFQEILRLIAELRPKPPPAPA